MKNSFTLPNTLHSHPPDVLASLFFFKPVVVEQLCSVFIGEEISTLFSRALWFKIGLAALLITRG